MASSSQQRATSMDETTTLGSRGRRRDDDDDADNYYDVVLIPVSNARVDLRTYLAGSDLSHFSGVMAASRDDTDTSLIKNIIEAGKLRTLELDPDRHCRLMYERNQPNKPLYIVPSRDIKRHLRNFSKDKQLYFAYWPNQDKLKPKAPEQLTIVGRIGYNARQSSPSRQVKEALRENDVDTDVESVFGTEQSQLMPATPPSRKSANAPVQTTSSASGVIRTPKATPSPRSQPTISTSRANTSSQGNSFDLANRRQSEPSNMRNASSASTFDFTESTSHSWRRNTHGSHSQDGDSEADDASHVSETTDNDSNLAAETNRQTILRAKSTLQPDRDNESRTVSREDPSTTVSRGSTVVKSNTAASKANSERNSVMTTTESTRPRAGVEASASTKEKWPYQFIKRGENHAYKCLLCGAIRETKGRKNRFAAQRHVVSLKFDNHAEWLHQNPWASKNVNSTSERNDSNSDETPIDNKEDEEDEEEEQSSQANDAIQSDERVDEDGNYSAEEEEEDTSNNIAPTKA